MAFFVWMLNVDDYFFLGVFALAGAFPGLDPSVFSAVTALPALAGLSPLVEISETSTGGSLGLSPRSRLST